MDTMDYTVIDQEDWDSLPDINKRKAPTMGKKRGRPLNPLREQIYDATYEEVLVNGKSINQTLDTNYSIMGMLSKLIPTDKAIRYAYHFELWKGIRRIRENDMRGILYQGTSVVLPDGRISQGEHLYMRAKDVLRDSARSDLTTMKAITDAIGRIENCPTIPATDKGTVISELRKIQSMLKVVV